MLGSCLSLPVSQRSMQSSGRSRPRAMQAVGYGICGSAGDLPQAQLRGSCRAGPIPAAAERCPPIQHLLEEPVSAHL